LIRRPGRGGCGTYHPSQHHLSFDCLAHHTDFTDAVKRECPDDGLVTIFQSSAAGVGFLLDEAFNVGLVDDSVVQVVGGLAALDEDALKVKLTVVLDQRAVLDTSAPAQRSGLEVGNLALGLEAAVDHILVALVAGEELNAVARGVLGDTALHRVLLAALEVDFRDGVHRGEGIAVDAVEQRVDLCKLHFVYSVALLCFPYTAFDHLHKKKR